jgi:hypothetical protein
VVNLERVGFNLKNFDMAIVFKVGGTVLLHGCKGVGARVCKRGVPVCVPVSVSVCACVFAGQCRLSGSQSCRLGASCLSGASEGRALHEVSGCRVARSPCLNHPRGMCTRRTW